MDLIFLSATHTHEQTCFYQYRRYRMWQA